MKYIQIPDKDIQRIPLDKMIFKLDRAPPRIYSSNLYETNKVFLQQPYKLTKGLFWDDITQYRNEFSNIDMTIKSLLSLISKTIEVREYIHQF